MNDHIKTGVVVQQACSCKRTIQFICQNLNILNLQMFRKRRYLFSKSRCLTRGPAFFVKSFLYTESALIDSLYIYISVTVNHFTLQCLDLTVLNCNNRPLGICHKCPSVMAIENIISNPGDCVLAVLTSHLIGDTTSCTAIIKIGSHQCGNKIHLRLFSSFGGQSFCGCHRYRSFGLLMPFTIIVKN